MIDFHNGEQRLVPSVTYRLFRQAILHRKQITCTYQGRNRELCAHVLGYKEGQEKALVFQFGGASNTHLPQGGAWRCLYLDEVQDAALRDGPWHSGPRHTRTQACVDVVDLDVNS